jgi:hypothetical protein
MAGVLAGSPAFAQTPPSWQKLGSGAPGYTRPASCTNPVLNGEQVIPVCVKNIWIFYDYDIFTCNDGSQFRIIQNTLTTDQKCSKADYKRTARHGHNAYGENWPPPDDEPQPVSTGQPPDSQPPIGDPPWWDKPDDPKEPPTEPPKAPDPPDGRHGTVLNPDGTEKTETPKTEKVETPKEEKTVEAPKTETTVPKTATPEAPHLITDPKTGRRLIEGELGVETTRPEIPVIVTTPIMPRANEQNVIDALKSRPSRTQPQVSKTEPAARIDTLKTNQSTNIDTPKTGPATHVDTKRTNPATHVDTKVDQPTTHVDTKKAEPTRVSTRHSPDTTQSQRTGAKTVRQTTINRTAVNRAQTMRPSYVRPTSSHFSAPSHMTTIRSAPSVGRMGGFRRGRDTQPDNETTPDAQPKN